MDGRINLGVSSVSVACRPKHFGDWTGADPVLLLFRLDICIHLGGWWVLASSLASIEATGDWRFIKNQPERSTRTYEAAKTPPV